MSITGLAVRAGDPTNTKELGGLNPEFFILYGPGAWRGNSYTSGSSSNSLRGTPVAGSRMKDKPFDSTIQDPKAGGVNYPATGDQVGVVSKKRVPLRFGLSVFPTFRARPLSPARVLGISPQPSRGSKILLREVVQ